MWSSTDLSQGPDHHNLIQNVTAGLVWRAAGLAVYGGHDNVIENSYVYDTLKYSGITVDTEFTPMYELSSTTTIRNTTVTRCGGLMWWDEDSDGIGPQRKWGAVWLFAADSTASNHFQGIRLENVDIIDPVYYGIMFQSTGQAIQDTTFDHVNIVMNQAGEYGMVANDSHKTGTIGAAGSITVSNSSISGTLVNSGNTFLKDSSSSAFVIRDGGGNSWTGDR